MIRKLFFLSCALIIAMVSSGIFPHAKVGAAFNQNNLMSDGMFENSGTMMAGDIDAFLNRYSNSCISQNSGFEAKVPTGYSPSGGFTFGGFASAGQVIATSAQVYGINPQVLLVTLQKEQSLVQGGTNFCNNGDENKYAAAMGYGCPDSGSAHNWTGVSLYRRSGVEHTDTGSTCVNTAAKAGFSQQVIRGAWLLKFGEQRSEGNVSWAIVRGSWDNSDDLATCYGGPMTEGNRARSKTSSSCNQVVFYDGYTTIDGTSVHMDTGATAALYWYTPHFHGNQNFVSIFEGWFGSTQAGSFTIANTTHPDGTLVQSFGEPEVYLIIDGVRYHVPDIDTFNSYGYSWPEVRIATIPDKQLAISGSKLAFKGGTLVRGDSTPQVYDLRCMPTFCVKDHIASIEVFSGLGLGFIDVLVIPQAKVDAMTTDKTISSATVHMQDQLVLDSSSGKVYLIDTGAKRWVSSLEVFSASHFKWPRVKTATPGDLALPDGPNVVFPEGAPLRANGDPAVYVVNQIGSGSYEKRHITSANTFAGLSYHLSDVFVVDGSFLPSATGADIAE